MQITYPSHHAWIKPIAKDHLQLFGDSAQRKIKASIDAAAASAISTVVKPLDAETLAWFIPMYEERMKQKHHPVIFDVSGTTLNKPNKNKSYYSLTLFEGGIPLGATIFSLSRNRLSIAYRTYSKAWLKASLPASPSLYTEWAIAEYAAQLNIHKFVHGRNRNPYGTFSSIGLAIFKLSVGCIPVKSTRFKLQATEINEYQEDVLILLEPQEKTKRISSALLIVAENNFLAYEQITKYPKQLNVEVVFRS